MAASRHTRYRQIADVAVSGRRARQDADMAASRHTRYRQIADPTISGRQAHQDAGMAVSGRPGCRRIGEPESIKQPADLESIKAPGSEIGRQPVTGVT